MLQSTEEGGEEGEESGEEGGKAAMNEYVEFCNKPKDKVRIRIWQRSLICRGGMYSFRKFLFFMIAKLEYYDSELEGPWHVIGHPRIRCCKLVGYIFGSQSCGMI